MVAPTTIGKPFLTYDEQLQKLRDKNLIINNEPYARLMLEHISYYALISGYKKPYKNTTTKNYIDNTTFEEIVALYKFDENLRELFLKYILKIEIHIRSLLSYYFTEEFTDNQSAYLNSNNYNPHFLREVNELINRHLNTKLTSNDYPYICHHRKLYNNVPLWVLVNTLSMGTISKMYKFMPSKIQSRISKHFPKVNEKALTQYLTVLSKFRNVCAHNERLFSYIVKDDIPNTILHSKLNITKIGSQYCMGKRDLFAIVIAFRYLLPKTDFLTFKGSLGRIVEHFDKQHTHITQSELLAHMNFPSNWKDISKYHI